MHTHKKGKKSSALDITWWVQASPNTLYGNGAESKSKQPIQKTILMKQSVLSFSTPYPYIGQGGAGIIQ